MSTTYYVVALLANEAEGLGEVTRARETFSSLDEAVAWMNGPEGDVFSALCECDLDRGWWVDDILVVDGDTLDLYADVWVQQPIEEVG